MGVSGEVTKASEAPLHAETEYWEAVHPSSMRGSAVWVKANNDVPYPLMSTKSQKLAHNPAIIIPYISPLIPHTNQWSGTGTLSDLWWWLNNRGIHSTDSLIYANAEGVTTRTMSSSPFSFRLHKGVALQDNTSPESMYLRLRHRSLRQVLAE